MPPVHLVSTDTSSPMPCAGNEPGSLILSGSDRSNHCSRMPALPRSNWNRHCPASEMWSDWDRRRPAATGANERDGDNQFKRKEDRSGSFHAPQCVIEPRRAKEKSLRACLKT